MNAERAGVHGLPGLRGWAVHLSPVPVAIAAAAPEWVGVEVRLLHDLAGGFAFALREVDEVWQACHPSHGIAGYVWELHGTAGPLPLGATMRMVHSTVMNGPNGRIGHASIEVMCEAFAEAASADIAVGRDTMADVVGTLLTATGMAQALVERLTTAWRAAPPSLAIQQLVTPTARNNLIGPIQLDAALVSEVDRLVAEAVRAAGVQPGEYGGQVAKELDNDVLAPAALNILTQRLGAHDLDELVLFGMIELERCTAYRDRLLRDVRQSSSQLTIDWDPPTRHSELEAQYLLLRRCGETAIEASLRSAPTGSQPIDHIAWLGIIAAAHAYLASTMRSEQVHHQLTPIRLSISDSFEISTVADECRSAAVEGAGARRVYNLDVESFRKARAAHQLEDISDDADDETPAQVDLVAPAVDDAMLQAFGASGSDILTTLFALAGWPLQTDEDDVITVPQEAVVQYVVESTVLGQDADGRLHIESAIDLLTSTAAELQAADWKPWHTRSRKRRLLIQPLPILTDGKLVVSPHLCLGSLSVYRNYLGQGQLPWSQPEPPHVVSTALDKIRDERNKALEKKTAELLRSGGWTVVANVKETKSRRLNVPSLSTEIDSVAGRADHGTIWLLEVKDPVETYASPDIRRSLDAFYLDGAKRAYCSQLQRKYNDLAPHAGAVAKALGLPPRSDRDPYVVKPMFVTRRPVPAAFVPGPFPFVSIDELLVVVARA